MALTVMYMAIVKRMMILCLGLWLMFATGMDNVNDTVLQGNSTDANKDMYVIHAMVYQVGIVTNKTDNETANMNNIGNQETFTIYHNNGSQVDLSQIPAPLVTNVTAQSLVGVAPVSSSGNSPVKLPWTTLNQLRSLGSPLNFEQRSTQSATHSNYQNRPERSMNNVYKSLFKRDTSDGNHTPVAIREGAAFIPQTAGVQSIAIPSLLALNKNLSQIPVPIPNTSVVRYTKINTLLTSP